MRTRPSLTETSGRLYVSVFFLPGKHPVSLPMAERERKQGGVRGGAQVNVNVGVGVTAVPPPFCPYCKVDLAPATESNPIPEWFYHSIDPDHHKVIQCVT